MTINVLVTGAAGYTGSILCEHLLTAGYRVTALDNLMYGQTSLTHLCANPDFGFTRGDSRDESIMRSLISSADVVIPLAAIVGAPACDLDPTMAESVNVGGIQVIEKLRSPGQLLVYPNTNSGYGIGASGQICTEDTPLEPISLYGRTKVRGEELTLDSPNSLTLRLATVFGASPRMRLDLLVNNFTYEAMTKGYLVVYEKNFKRNYVHIRDVADCYLHCIENADAMVGRAYNVGLDNANLSKEELAYSIKEFIPEFYLHFSEIGKDPDKRNYIVSNQRLSDSGFKANRSLSEGIQELIKAYSMLGRGPWSNV